MILFDRFDENGDFDFDHAEFLEEGRPCRWDELPGLPSQGQMLQM